MWKLIFLGLAVWLAVYILKRSFNPNRNNGPDNAEAENMVQCSTCQVHVPRSEAFLVNGKFYCSKAHIENK